jgi:glutamate dehydrogenase (NADP+)
MTELFRYIHPSTDVPAGDIGVGGREMGYMYGTYKRLANRHGDGVLTGKGIDWGGSHFRPEATGYGLVYMTKLIIEKQLKKSMQGLRVAVSGAGNVAQFTAQKLLQLGAKVITMSDSSGVIVFDDGMTRDDWNKIVELKNVRRGRLSELGRTVSGTYTEGRTPWSIGVPYDVALPCATQNEICEEEAEQLVKNNVIAVLEGANLPTNAGAQKVFRDAENVVYIPGKASNAGGVGVSGMEMSQNAQRLTWTQEEVDQKLQVMMENIYDSMKNGEKNGESLEQGANRAAFIKVARAMKDLGWVY